MVLNATWDIIIIILMMTMIMIIIIVLHGQEEERKDGKNVCREKRSLKQKLK